MQTTATRLYADGGLVGTNPSKRGGTWAWYAVDGMDNRVESASGYVRPKDIGLPVVTNNVTELLAAVLGLESLPIGWNGTVYTDSIITFHRLRRSKKFVGVPEWLKERTLKARGCRLFRVVLLAGHPSEKDLDAGHRQDGTPVSRWNVCCDEACKIRSREFEAINSA